MINEYIYPKHLSRSFLELYKNIVTQRLEAKKKGDKIVADALKIVVNAVYGKLNFEYGWMYDSKASYSVTLTGQLYLLMLVEELEEHGISIFYANTDGLTCKIPVDLEDIFKNICKKWEKLTNLELEYSDYKKCVIRDVNNYVIVKDDGEVKTKGAFVTGVDISKGYDKPIISKALYEYFVNGVDIKDTITNHTDIYDFCMSQKVGNQYTQEYHYLDEDKSNLIIDTLQKTNRYFVSNGSNKMYKRHKEKKNLNDLVAGYNVTLFNDYYESEDYNINYRYYISVAQKIINIMEPAQLKLF